VDAADGAPELRRVTIHGGDAERWRHRHSDLFLLPEKDGLLQAGPTEVVFEQVDGTPTEITLQFAVENPDVSIPLQAGGFEFVR
jgi:hypothetical protein